MIFNLGFLLSHVAGSAIGLLKGFFKSSSFSWVLVLTGSKMTLCIILAVHKVMWVFSDG